MSQIAVITRTSNRPKYFSRCYNSVLGQPLVGSHHILYDDPKDIKYLTNDLSVTKHYIDISQIIYNENAPTSAGIPPKQCLYNLYFNYGIYNIVKEPWIYHLDDDNYLSNNAFVGLENYLIGDADMIIFKIYLNHQKWILPSLDDFTNRRIELSNIDTGCFLIRTNIARQLKWDGWRAGDYRFILKCSKLSKKTLWIDKIVMQQDASNNGNKQDCE